MENISKMQSGRVFAQWVTYIVFLNIIYPSYEVILTTFVILNTWLYNYFYKHL